MIAPRPFSRTGGFPFQGSERCLQALPVSTEIIFYDFRLTVRRIGVYIVDTRGNRMDQSKEVYLGDGCYVSNDGWQICLRAPREGGDHVVYLDPQVAAALLSYLESLRK